MFEVNGCREYLSYSRLATMLACPYRYYLQYVEGRDWDYVPSSISFGEVVHGILRDFHEALRNETAVDKMKFVDSFSAKFVRDASRDNVIFRDDAEFDELLDRGQALIAEYIDTFSHLQPMEVELEFRLPMVDANTGRLHEKDIVGRIDMVSQGGEVYELKTSSSSLPEAAIYENLQLILYGWAFRMIYGEAPKKLVLVNLVKTKNPRIQLLETIADVQREAKLLNLMFKVDEAIEKGCFYPNPRSPFGCGSCYYSLSCEYVF